MAKYTTDPRTYKAIASILRENGIDSLFYPSDLVNGVAELANKKGPEFETYSGQTSFAPQKTEQIAYVGNMIVPTNIVFEGIKIHRVPNGQGGYTITIGE